ncbi:hypothetical protein B0H10DRAFT_1960220 [Mycena sp. CBHHK59/15]|nr:hypothetical protein B0H10DRAFT_1960220 [Mycena sp. CBHHK59/15]
MSGKTRAAGASGLDNPQYDQQVLGDSFAHSDDLLMQHDPRLSEQQKQFAPDVPLKVTSKSDWWCWQECLLDIMSGFPRSGFSEKELNATRWYTRKNESADSLPSNKNFPISRTPKMHLYAEDTGESLEEARQALNGKMRLTEWQDMGRCPPIANDFGERCICILRPENNGKLDPWNQPTTNPWRLKGNGCRMLYNVHFIATSNISPPLEMMEAVSSMLRFQRGGKEGIEVWDCVYREYILVIPWFLAFQGDNPMTPWAAGEISRIKEFMTAGKPRTKEETIADLESQLKRVLDATGASNKLKEQQKQSGYTTSLLELRKPMNQILVADAVSRQNTKGKEELKARISSIDVAGLNSPRLRGNIKLAPLMFQPAIPHLPTYFSNLNNAVADFLAATALWNTQWFNKPKFHLFVHLVEHIRRFGPLILYATETFESYNLVIRGGYVLQDTCGKPLPIPRQAGPQILALLEDSEFVQLMSMRGLIESPTSVYTPLRQSGPCLWEETMSSSMALGATAGVGRIEEILVDMDHDSVLGVLVSKCTIGPDVLHTVFLPVP